MWRQTILFCVCTLLGTVTTLAVAWACATWSDLLEQTPAAKLTQATPDNGWLRFSRHRGFGARRHETSAFIAHVAASGNATSTHITVQDSGGYVKISGLVGLHLIESPYTIHLPIDDPYWSRLANLSNFDNQSGDFVDEEGAFGWPVLAMWCSYYTMPWKKDESGKRTWHPARNESLPSTLCIFTTSPAGRFGRSPSTVATDRARVRGRYGFLFVRLVVRVNRRQEGEAMETVGKGTMRTLCV